MYLALIDFVQPEALSHPPHDVASLTLQLLESPLYVSEALDLLTAITSHKLPSSLFQLLLTRIPYVNYARSNDPLQSLLQLRALSDAVLSLLSVNISEDYICSLNSAVVSPDLLPLLVNVLSFILSLLQQFPSRKMTLSSLSHFNRILKIDCIYSIPKIDEYLLTLFELIAVRMNRAQYIDEVPVNQVDQLEFEEREELTEVFGLIRTKARELAKLLVVKYPVGMAGVVERRLNAVLHMDGDLIDHVENHDCSSHATAYVEWEGFAYVTLIVFKEMEGSIDPLVVPLAERMTARLIQHETHHTVLFNEKLTALEYLSLVLPKSSLQELLSHLFYCLDNKTTSNSNRIAATLSAIASHSRLRIIEGNLVVWCCTLAQSAFDSGRLTHSDNTHLTELILTLSSGIASADQRMQILQAAVGSRVNFLTSDEVSSLLISPQALLTACRSQGNNLNSINDLRIVLESIFSIAKKTIAPDLPSKYWLSQDEAMRKDDMLAYFAFAVVWDAILDRLVMILRCLHSLYQPRFRIEFVQNGYSSLYLHPSLFTDEDSVIDREVVDRLESLRLLTYQLLGQACIHRVLTIHATAFNTLVQDLQNSLSYMENHHLVRLIKHVIEPLVIHTLPSSYKAISSLLGIIINNLYTRLTLATCRNAPVISNEEDKFYWFLYVECGISVKQNFSPEVLEVRRNDVLYSLSRAVVDMYSGCLGMRGILAVSPTASQDSLESSKPQGLPSKAKTKFRTEESKSFDGNSLSEEIKKLRIQKLEDLLLGSSYSLWEPTFNSLLVMLNFQDAYTCRKTITVS